MQNFPVLLTKINPPQISARALDRPRVTSALIEALEYRLTVVQAGAGYGKSTAVMSLVERHKPLIWYQISREDADPFVFLQHLLHATQIALPELQGLPIPFLESWDASRGPLTPITCTKTPRWRGLTSKSMNKICCQVPSANRPSMMGTESEGPMSAARRWA